MNSYQENNNPMEESEFLKNLAVLREISFFAEFPLEVLKVLAYLCTREDFEAGEIIFSQDDDDGRAYCIVSGETRLSRTHENKEVFIRACGVNSFFGAFTLAGRATRLFTLTAASDTCCLVLAREDFQEAVKQFPETKQCIIKGLTDNIISWEKGFLRENIDCESCRRTMGVSLT